MRVEKGPKDVREIPGYFGRAAAARHYGAWDIEIVAEINNAPRLTRAALASEAEYFRASGADVIDIGCTPGLAFPALGDVVRELVAAGMRVSVDTFEPDEIRTAVAAGAELVLSVNGSNIDVAQDLAGTGARVVVVPDLGGALDTLEPSLEKLTRWSVPYLIDPILEPIGFGFMASLERYAEVRRRYPDAEMLMGIGNLTELTVGRLHRRERHDDRGLPGAGRPRGADHGGDPVGARRGARSGCRPAPDALRDYSAHDSQGGRRSPGHRQGSGRPRVHRTGAPRAAGRRSPIPISASSPIATASRC